MDDLTRITFEQLAEMGYPPKPPAGRGWCVKISGILHPAQIHKSRQSHDSRKGVRCER